MVSFELGMMTGRQGLPMRRTGKEGLDMKMTGSRSQDWVDGWISWISLTASLSTSTQRPQPRLELVQQWLRDNEEVVEGEVIEDEEKDDQTKQKYSGRRNFNKIPFVILPFSRKVLPILPKHLTNVKTQQLLH